MVDELHFYLLNGKSIVETGSNANGNYIKYADGTLEMWGKKTAQYHCRTAAGNGYVSSEIPVTFPLDSLTACNIEVQQVVGSISGVFAGASAISALTGFNVYVVALFQIQEARTGYFHWRATGTWK